MEDKQYPVFIVGCFRSGTTLLRMILIQHPDIWIPEETAYIPEIHERISEYGELSKEENLRSLIEDIFNLLKKKAGWQVVPSYYEIAHTLKNSTFQEIVKVVALWGHGEKKIWGDNTPYYVNSIFTLNSLFPKAKFINIVRDGRDVAASAIDIHIGGFTPLRLAEEWNHKVLSGLLAQNKLSEEKIITIQYENLVRFPDKVIPKLCQFLDVEFVENMLHPYLNKNVNIIERQSHHRNLTNPINSDSIGKFKKRFTKEEIIEIERIISNTLYYYGYELSNNHLDYENKNKIYKNHVLNYLLYRTFRIKRHRLLNSIINKIKNYLST